ncbi:MAG: sigma 54-interacting transcriptional regulator [Arachidicoccus sp.]|nr:sigma 54-interacting transcriptional regulator [Arachidicoccus sp.]
MLTRFLRHALAIATVGIALGALLIFQHFPVRRPFMLVYLAAIAVTFWYGGEGPGIAAFVLSTGCLLGEFFTSEHGWQGLVVYDWPGLCIYVVFSWWIRAFVDSRRRLESMLLRNSTVLEDAVKARTDELLRVNTESKTILDAAPFGVVLFGPDRIVVRCNPAYETMIGYGPGELRGTHAPLPEDQLETWRELEETLREGKPVVGREVQRVRRNGAQFPATIWLTPLEGSDGEFVGMVGFILDDTERNAHEAERQMLSMLVARSPEFIGVADESGNLTFVNPAGKRLLGLEAKGEVAQPRVPDEVWNSLPRRRTDAFIKAQESEESHFCLEMRYPLTGNGTAVHLYYTSFAIPPMEPGGATLWAIVAQNVTERKAAETRLRESLDENCRLLEENKALQEKLRHENISLQEQNRALQNEIAEIQKTKFDRIVGQSSALRRVLNKVALVAVTDVTVLITGETGTGKELVAQAIHENSKRAAMPFRAFNCASLPASLMASELFGHEKGAFTGADRQRLGQFELAAGGTLFLDEIAELSVEEQAVLLRVLEERSFERLGGGGKLIPMDARIIVATNRDLPAAIQAGAFRQDLFFRLNGFRIEVPPLRERVEDIPLLVEHFVRALAARHGKSIRNIQKRSMEMLMGYGWPGNIRELRNVIEMSVVISPGDELLIDEELLFGVPSLSDGASGTLEERVAHFERALIERALAQTRGRVAGPAGAASLLGVPPSTLSEKMTRLKIVASTFKSSTD